MNRSSFDEQKMLATENSTPDRSPPNRPANMWGNQSDHVVHPAVLESGTDLSKVEAAYEEHADVPDIEATPNASPEDPWTLGRWMLFTAMGFLWTGSQIPLYLYGGILEAIEEDIGGKDRYVWILLAYLIPLASITPFVGPLSDLVGRKALGLAAVASMLIGCVVNGVAQDMDVFIGGMVFLGLGAGVLELTSLAVVGESAPTQKRGLYIGCIIVTIVPYCPSVVYAQMVASVATWRWISLWIGLWNLVGGALMLAYYFPPPRVNSLGLKKRELAKRIDVTGGILSTGGVTLFLMALTWGGDQYTWKSAHVIVTLALGLVLMACWLVWEVFFVRYPMFPRRLGANKKILTLILIITFVSGGNFFSVLIFWPEEYFVTYANYADPVSIGLGSLPVGFCIIGGSIIFSILVTVLRGRIRLLMILSTGIMLAGTGAMAAARLNNLPGVYAALCFACLGVGAVIVPCQVVSTIICPPDLIASITALTISVRMIGGAIAYAIYYYVLRKAFIKQAYKLIVPVIAEDGIGNIQEYVDIIETISGNLADTLHTFPGIDSPEKVARLVQAGQEAFSKAFPIVYLVSLAFGGSAFVASFFLPDVDMFMDEHIAVHYKR